MLLCIGICAPVALGQKKVSKAKHADVYVSKKSKRKPGQTISEFTKIEDDSYEIKLRSKGEFEYVTYDDELNVVDKRTEKQPKKKEGKDYGKADIMRFDFGGTRYHLMGTTERDAKRNVFTIREIDEDGEEVGSPEELGQLNGEEYYFIIENAKLDYWISNDESKLLISYKLPEKRDQDRVKYRRYRYMVFDTELNLLWEKVVDFKHKDGRVSYGGNARIDNNGDVFCYGAVDRGRKFKKDERFGINLYYFTEDSEESRRVNGIRLGGVTADVIDGEYTLFCTYGVDGFTFLWFGSPGGEEGFLSLRWNGEDEHPKVVKTPFGADHVTINQPSKERKKWKAKEKKGKSVNVPRLVIDEVILQEDGGYMVLAQEQFVVVTTSRSGRTSTKYYNLDIHVFELNSDFGISWSTIIPCYQRMGSTDHSGYVYKQIGRKLYFIFNDNYRNLEKDWNPTKRPNVFSGGEHPTTLVVVDMDEDSNQRLKRELLWKAKSVGGSFRPRLYESPDDKKFGLVYIQGGKLKQSLLRIDFKEPD